MPSDKTSKLHTPGEALQGILEAAAVLFAACGRESLPKASTDIQLSLEDLGVIAQRTLPCKEPLQGSLQCLNSVEALDT